MADGSIVINVKLDKDIKADLRKGQKAIEDFGKKGSDSVKKLNVRFSSFSSTLKGFLGAQAIIGGFKAIISGVQGLTTGFAAAGDQVAKTADKLGVGVEALQELRFAAERSGVGAAQLDVGLQRLTRRAAEAAEGTGVAKVAFERLGIELKDNQGNVRATEDIFEDLAGAFQGVESQSERVRLAFQLFDTEGVALVNLLGQGEEGLQKFRDRARELGGVIENDAARAAENFADVQQDLNFALTGLRNTVGTAVLPVLSDLAMSFTELLTENKDLIVNGIRVSVAAFKELIKSIGPIASTVIAIVGPILKLQAALLKFVLGPIPDGLKLLFKPFLDFADQVGGVGNAITFVTTELKISFLEIANSALRATISLLKLSDAAGVGEGALISAASALQQNKIEISKLKREQDAFLVRQREATQGTKDNTDATKENTEAKKESSAEERRRARLVEQVQKSREEAREKEREQDEIDAIDREIAFEERLIQDEEFKARADEIKAEGDAEALDQLKLQAQIEEQIQRDSKKKQEKEQLASNARFLKNQQKFGAAFASINEIVNSTEIQGRKETLGDLAALTQSENKKLKAIGKAASVVQIGIKTAEGAVKAYSSLAGIPIVGPALGLAAAGALIAFGAEQTAKVLKAQRGGVVPNVGLSSSNPANTDRVPALLSPGEFIVPQKDFDAVVDAIIATRSTDTEAEAPAIPDDARAGGATEVMIGFDGAEASQVLTARQNEDRALGISPQGDS